MTGIPVVVTAELDSSAVGITEAPFMLDAPLSWAAVMADKKDGLPVDPITQENAPDMDLPLTQWHEGETWGWCCSQASIDVASYTSAEIRRKPAVGPMSRYTREKKHHSGLGPHKARDTVVATAWVSSVTWWAVSTDLYRLERLLSLVTHLGGRTTIGHGHVAQWTVVEGGSVESWRDRPMPVPGQPPRAYRAPYWHPTRQVTTCPA